MRSFILIATFFIPLFLFAAPNTGGESSRLIPRFQVDPSVEKLLFFKFTLPVESENSADEIDRRRLGLRSKSPFQQVLGIIKGLVGPTEYIQEGAPNIHGKAMGVLIKQRFSDGGGSFLIRVVDEPKHVEVPASEAMFVPVVTVELILSYSNRPQGLSPTQWMFLKHLTEYLVTFRSMLVEHPLLAKPLQVTLIDKAMSALDPDQTANWKQMIRQLKLNSYSESFGFDPVSVSLFLKYLEDPNFFEHQGVKQKLLALLSGPAEVSTLNLQSRLTNLLAEETLRPAAEQTKPPVPNFAMTAPVRAAVFSCGNLYPH